MDKQTFVVPTHPYYPLDAHIPDYAANVSSLTELSVQFATLLALTIATALWLATRCNPNLPAGDQFIIGWYTLCGTLHCFFEGYFVANHAKLARSQHLFAQLWKEYALSDSRYLTSDPFMLCVEAITAVLWGPLCFATALSYARQGSSRRLRHPLALVTSVAHLYGVALYYATCYVEEAYRGTVYSRPEFLYFWVYYVGFNAPWVLVPIGILTQSIRSITLSSAAFDKVADVLDKKRKDGMPRSATGTTTTPSPRRSSHGARKREATHFFPNPASNTPDEKRERSPPLSSDSVRNRDL